MYKRIETVFFIGIAFFSLVYLSYLLPVSMSTIAQIAENLTDDEIFRSNFDRSSASFHNGLAVPVPVGGARVPDQMKDHQNWQELPVVEQAVSSPSDFGEEYFTVHNARECRNAIKKSIALLSPILAAFNDHYKAMKENPNTVSQQKLDQLANERNGFLDILVEQCAGFNASYASDVIAMLDSAKLLAEGNDGKTYEANYPQWLAISKKVTTKLFAEQNKMLQEMKALKKVFLQNQK